MELTLIKEGDVKLYYTPTTIERYKFTLKEREQSPDSIGIILFEVRDEIGYFCLRTLQLGEKVDEDALQKANCLKMEGKGYAIETITDDGEYYRLDYSKVGRYVMLLSGYIDKTSPDDIQANYEVPVQLEEKTEKAFNSIHEALEGDRSKLMDAFEDLARVLKDITEIKAVSDWIRSIGSTIAGSKIIEEQESD